MSKNISSIYTLYQFTYSINGIINTTAKNKIIATNIVKIISPMLFLNNRNIK